jgi:membrane associated rhomboid family serine protease
MAKWNAVHTIIALNVLVFIVQYYLGYATGKQLDPHTGEIMHIGLGGVSLDGLRGGQVWTPFTYMFVHGGLMHLVGNMLLIGWLGARIVELLGSRQFLLIYFGGGLVGAAFQLVASGLQHDFTTPIVGASACAFGLLFALAAMLPHERITMLIYFIIPVNLRLWTLATGLMVIEIFLGLTSAFSASAAGMWGGIAYFAHVGGALAGWYVVRLLGYGGNPMTYARLWRHQSAARQPKRQRVSSSARRVRAATPDMDLEAVRRKQPATRKTRPALSMIEEVDAVLDKISVHGMSSLSDEERRLLDMASREIAQRDQSRKDGAKL